MASIPPEEKVLLVGHSLDGMNLAFAMDMYPEKIKVAVFLAALMPDTTHKLPYVVEQWLEGIPAEEWLDTEFKSFGSPNENLISLIFGPNFISSKLYAQSPLEDVALANTLVRLGSLFLPDLSNRSPFSKERDGSMKRVFILCRKDKALS
ncbi:UNVERIFIED_CONTAM: Salicylic acid-binding protein 2 [Sesamum latifolium]|uniref:Salicylic acid-binding protein 2 n=1 Tax=Sesamum latifolium TaxID=2727402 RepID=A0AAW2XBW3_9LAMI